MVVVSAYILVLLSSEAVLFSLRADLEVTAPVVLAPVVRLHQVVINLKEILPKKWLTVYHPVPSKNLNVKLDRIPGLSMVGFMNSIGRKTLSQ